MDNLPAVDIVTVSYNSAKHFPRYLRALRRQIYPPRLVRLIVVDNASPDASADAIEEWMRDLPFASELLRSRENLGFGGGCNRGAEHGTAPYILFLNPDTEVAPEMLARLVERAVAELAVGLVDAAQEPIEIPKWRDAGSNYTDWCSGAAVLASRRAFEEVGRFDRFFHPAYCEDVDLSWRMWLAGWKCVHEPRARFVHHTGETLKPAEIRYATRYSFAMHCVYDTLGGALRHLIRGLRYALSPRSEALRRQGAWEGLWTVLISARYLSSRRRQVQARLRRSSERARFVFTEWDYGRWMTAPAAEACDA
jgi:GT2 family glycosyltransferase